MSRHPFEYQKPTEDQVRRMKLVNDLMKATYQSMLDNAPDNDNRKLAITKLQEARMWLNAAIVLE